MKEKLGIVYEKAHIIAKETDSIPRPSEYLGISSSLSLA